MDLLVVNIPFIIVCIFLIWNVTKSVKRGIVRGICDVISITVASVVVLLIAFAARKYMDHERVLFVATVILLVLLILIYRIIDIFLTTLKIIAKLPVVSFVNKLMGIPFAIAETVILVWAVYCLILIMDAGAFEVWVMNCVRSNPVMSFLYANNYIYGKTYKKGV